MTPEQHTLAIKYMMGKLAPEEQDELKVLLGDDDNASEDLAEDALKGRVAMDRLPSRLKKIAVARCIIPPKPEDRQAYDALFPNARRLK